MFFNRFVCFLFVITVFFSCNKILDTTPTSQIDINSYYSSLPELESALAGVYNILLQVNNGIQNIYVELNTTDECAFSNSNVSGLGTFTHTYADANVANLWRALYGGIANANVLIDNIDKATKATQEQRDAILGEALFLRAYYYFMLASYFGDVPLILHTTTNPAETDMPRSALSKVYAQILADMQEAEKKVYTKTQRGNGALAATHVTKTTVQGIITRVCLRMAGAPLNDIEKYKMARTYAKLVIDSKEHALITNITTPECPSAYAQVFINAILDQYNPAESMWEIDFSTFNGGVHAGGILGSLIGVNYTSKDLSDIGRGYIRLIINGSLYALYENNGVGKKDLRRDWNIAPYSFGKGKLAQQDTITVPAIATNTFINTLYPGKWRRSYDEKNLLSPTIQNVMNTINASYTSINAPLLRYADVLLMFAEADYQVQGSVTADALYAINQVRRRAYGKTIEVNTTGVDFTTSYPTDFLKGIQDERARELCFETHRRNDLIRWGIFLQTMNAMTSNSHTYFRDYKGDILSKYKGIATKQTTIYQNVYDKHLLLPIPATELNNNKGITYQNEGW